MTITVYSLPGCAQCTLTKSWLNKNGIEYRAVDLLDSPEDAAAIESLGYQSAPVVVVSNGDAETDLHWSGFIPDNLKRYAGHAAAA